MTAWGHDLSGKTPNAALQKIRVLEWHSGAHTQRLAPASEREDRGGEDEWISPSGAVVRTNFRFICSVCSKTSDRG